jgi:CubicO group peptidase (beta-lactamase class C family)
MGLTACGPAALLLLAALAGASAAHAQADRRIAPALDPQILQRIDSAFAEWSGTDTPGCVAAAERAGRLLFSRAYGMANLEHGVPVTRASVFEAGSISKQLTAAAVLLLAAEGRIQLADDVRSYIPELPDYGAVVTIDHLLTHSAGVSDWGTMVYHAGWPRGDRVYTNAVALEMIARHPTLIFAPGSFFSYTNSGYTLLTEVVERVTGTSLPVFTEERIFGPLGMTATRWRDDYRAIVPGRTTAYRRRGNGEFIEEMPFEHAYGQAGLLTTVDDLLIWNRALQERRLGASVAAEMERRGADSGGHALPYGRGLWIGSFKGTAELSHGGATAGYRGWLARYPETGLSVALLCNGPANDAGLGRMIANEFLADPVASTPAGAPAAAAASAPAPALTAAEASSLAGHFVREKLGTPFTVTAAGDTLRISGEIAVPLGGNRFRISWGEFRFEGRDVLHELAADGSTFQRFHRIDGPLPESLEPFAGRYRNPATVASYVVSSDAGQLAIQVEGRPGWVLRYTPIGPDVFRSTGTVVRAHRDASGRVVSLTLSANQLRDLRLVRAED